MIEPKSWRILGDDSTPEAFIPATPRSIAVMEEILRLQRGEYTDEERAEMEHYAAAEAAKREAKQQRALRRHAQLLRTATHPILTTLLEAHGPNEYRDDDGVLTGYACHACPMDYSDEYGDGTYQGWPCPTWGLIDKEAS